MTNPRLKRITAFTWEEWKWIIIIVMLGVVMYWTAIVIEPTYILLQQMHELQELAVERTKIAESNVKLLVENQNNNTKTLQTLITGLGDLKENQVVLVRELGNATKDLGLKSADIDTNSKVLVLQSAGLLNLLNESEEFNQKWEREDRTRSGHILGNVSDIRDTLKLLELVLDREENRTG